MTRGCLRCLPILLGLALLPGCALLQSLLGSTQQPSAKVTDVRISELSLSELTLVFDVAITNPYTVPLPLVNIDYAVASQGKPFLQGQAALQGDVPAGQTKTVSLPAKVVFVELLKLLQSVRPGAIIPYHGTLGLSVNAPVLGALRLPLEKDGTLPVPAPPSVSIASVRWQQLSFAGVAGVLALRVANPNAFGFDVAGLDYDIKLGGHPLARGGLVQAASVAAGAAQELGIQVSLSTAQAGMGLLQLLQGQSSGYSLDGALSIGTPFGPLRVPLRVAGTVPFLH